MRLIPLGHQILQPDEKAIAALISSVGLNLWRSRGTYLQQEHLQKET
jgi:hypothetical protein